MRSRSYIFIIAIIIVDLFSYISAHGKELQLFDDIILLTNGSIEEVGIKVSFKIEDSGEESLKKVFTTLNIEDIDSVESSTDHGNYSLNFSGKKASGTIVNIRESSGSSIVLNIIEKSTYNNLVEIKENILKSLKLGNKNFQYSYHIKAKVPSNYVVSINDDILGFLESNGSTNIDSIDINNGYSTTAYTKLFEPIESNSKLIDFNYAVVEYSSGAYILLGTPIIMISY